MQGLMLKLLNVDADGERALRVVAYFDQLLLHQPTLDSVVRASAVIADCVVGLNMPSLGLRITFGPDGLERPTPTNLETGTRQTVDGPADTQGFVWLDRGDARGDLDDFILERMALTVAGVIARTAPTAQAETATGLADPALAQLLVNANANDAERSRAASLMGIEPGSRLQLVAVQADFGDPTRVEHLVNALRLAWQRRVLAAPLSREIVIAISVGRTPVIWDDVSIDVRAASSGVVEVLDAPAAWSMSRTALQFAGLGSSWPKRLDAKQVGVLSVLAKIDPSTVRHDPDVQRINTLAASSGGAEAIRILDIVLHADSLRSAAREANFHHSSVQSRLATIERRFGISVRTGLDRQRIATALLIWQMLNVN